MRAGLLVGLAIACTGCTATPVPPPPLTPSADPSPLAAPPASPSGASAEAAVAAFRQFAAAYFDFAKVGYRVEAIPAELLAVTVDAERVRLADELNLLRKTGMHVADGTSRITWVSALGVRGEPFPEAVTVRACVDNTMLTFASPAPPDPPKFVTYDAVVKRVNDQSWKVASVEFTWEESC